MFKFSSSFQPLAHVHRIERNALYPRYILFSLSFSSNTKITIEGKIAILFLPWIDRNAYRSNRKRQAAPRRLSLYESARRSRLSLSLILSLFLSPSLSPFLSLFPFCHDLVSEGIERKKKKKKKRKRNRISPAPEGCHYSRTNDNKCHTSTRLVFLSLSSSNSLITKRRPFRGW